MATTTAKKTPAAQNTRQQLDELDALLQKMLALPVNPADAAPEEDEQPEPTPVSEPRRTENTVLPRRVSLRPTPQQAPVEQKPLEESPPLLGPRLVQPEAALPVREIVTNDEQPDEDWVPLRGDWQPSAQTWGPLAEIFKQQVQQDQQPAPVVQDDPNARRETVVLPTPTPTRNPAELPHLPTPTPEPEVPTSSAEAMARLHAARKPAVTPTPSTPAPLPRPGPALAVLPLLAVNRLYDALTYPLGPLGTWLRGGTGRGVLAFLGGVFLAAAGIILALDWCEWTW